MYINPQGKGEGMKPGIHQGIPMAQYLALDALSSGLCNTLLQCSPFHAAWQQKHRDEDASAASDIGTAIHDVLLEGIDRIVPIDAPDWRTKAAKEAREQARANGGIPMLLHKVAQIDAAVKAAKAYIAGSELAGVFDTGAPEQVMIWQEDGALCKARPDWLTADHSVLLHVKTTSGSANPESWIRNQLVNSGYDVACAFYERGLSEARGAALPKPPLSVFLVIEQNAPHGCSLVALSPAMMDLASRKVARAIDAWSACRSANRWPAYPSRIAYAEPRNWDIQAEEEGAFRHFDEDELRGGIPL